MSSATFDREQPEPAAPSWLDRSLDLDALGWATLGWVVVLGAAIALRFAKLSGWALSPDEARHAYDAWLLFRGQPAPAGEAIPQTAPLFLLLQAIAFFLFGATDAVARIVPAICGLGIVALVPLLRRRLGGPATLGMAALAAVSPTLVYASRVGNPEIVVAFLALLLVVAIVRAGDEGAGEARRWAVVAGFALGALPAAGPSALTVLVTLAVAALIASREPDGAVRQGFAALARTRGAMPLLVATAIATLIVCFTRLFSDPAAIAGIGRTAGDWFGLLAGQSPLVPTAFFLLALLLYEPLALLLALVGVARGRALPRAGSLGTLLGAWFVAALLAWSFSAGRAPEHAVHVALPLVLLAGGVLGDTLSRIDWEDVRRGPGGPLALALLGFVVALVALDVLLRRVDDPFAGQVPALPAAVVAMLVVVPLAYAIWILARAERIAGRPGQTSRIVLLVAALLLGLFTLRSATLLAFYRAADGTELLAQQTATGAILPAVERLDRLSRDATVDQTSVRDPTGGHGLVIAAEAPAAWPFRWYFRDYPDFSVVDPGAALSGQDQPQVVIAPTDAGMAAAGFTPRAYPWVNGLPGPYAAPDTPSLIGAILNPARWLDGLRFLFFREGIVPPSPATVTIGLDGPLAARVYPSTGPYNLGDRPGPGAAPGQFNQPLGIGVAPDGTTYVVDQGNSRIERFDAAGRFLGAWGKEEGLDLAQTTNGLGATGLTVDRDGLVYVADTWNHRIVVLDPNGKTVREIGGPVGAGGVRVAADTTDDPSLVDTKTGEFFGPRAVAVTADEVYVVDTGNERVQVFGKDGAFRRVWGGYGTGPGQLIEPGGIAIGPDGRVYVADAGNGRISVFTPAGEPVAQWPVAAWPAKDPSGARPSFQPYLAFGRDGALYASSSRSGSVEVLDRSGKAIDSITSVNNARLSLPIGLAVAPDGTLLIGDVGQNAVLRYTPPARPAIAPAGASPAASPVVSPRAATPVR